MLDQFQAWLEEVRNSAVDYKVTTAKKRGIANWKKVIWTSPMKNAAIKAKFAEMAEKVGMPGRDQIKCRPSRKAGEWLYDLVWRRFDQEGNLVEVILAMEIEVSYMQECTKRYDFNKLLQADSTYKVFVFQQKTKEDVEAGLQRLKFAAAQYRFRSDSEFLLCGWSTQKNEFIFDRFHARREADLVS